MAIVMGDGSDDPRDLILISPGACVTATTVRSARDSYRDASVRDYPKLKLAINRRRQLGIRMLFRHGYNDTTNAFKAYRREVIENIQPLLSNHFNLTVGKCHSRP